MNILILSWRGPGHPNAGGAEIVTFEHARAWARAGHSVVLFTSVFSGMRKSGELIDGVKIIRHGGQTFGVKFQAFFWYLFENKISFDLVVDEFHGIPFFTPLYIRTKKLAFIHEVTKKEVWAMNPWPKPINYIPKYIGPLFEPLIFRLIYSNIHFMTVSKSTESELREWGVKKSSIDVINNGVVLLRKLPNRTKNKDVMISYLGALSKDKGVEDALMVFDNLHKLHPDWRFWIIGYGEKHYLNNLKILSKNLGLQKRLKFWGFVDQEKKFQLLSQTTILINPSIREGWGLVVIEAASVGTPTVGYDVPGLRDSIRNGVTGVLCQPNPDSMATEVMRLQSNPKKYNKMTSNASIWASKFRWSKSTVESLKLIRRIADK